MLSRWATGLGLLGIVTGSTREIEGGQRSVQELESSDSASMAVFADVLSPALDALCRSCAHRECTGEAIIGCLCLNPPAIST